MSVKEERSGGDSGLPVPQDVTKGRKGQKEGTVMSQRPLLQINTEGEVVSA